MLISLMLSSQTKDEIVGKAMSKLKENGLTINSILDTPQEEIARMIFPVGFWNVGVHLNSLANICSRLIGINMHFTEESRVHQKDY